MRVASLRCARTFRCGIRQGESGKGALLSSPQLVVRPGRDSSFPGSFFNNRKAVVDGLGRGVGRNKRRGEEIR